MEKNETQATTNKSTGTISTTNGISTTPREEPPPIRETTRAQGGVRE